MTQEFARAACAVFLLVLGGARLYYVRESRAHPHAEGSPHVGWFKQIPAYLTSTLWTTYVGVWVVAPDRLFGWGSWSFSVMSGPVIQVAGTALMAAGLWLFWFSHRAIGRYWSIQVKLKEDHRLIRQGPYRYIRHPLYTSFFLGYAGTLLVVQSWAMIGLAPFLVGSYVIFAREEERMLGQAFGLAYDAYRREAGMFFFRFVRR